MYVCATAERYLRTCKLRLFWNVAARKTCVSCFAVPFQEVQFTSKVPVQGYLFKTRVSCFGVPFQGVPYTSKYLFKTGVSPCHRCHSCARSGTNLHRRSSVLCIMLRGTFSRGTLYLGAHLPFQEVALFEHSLVPAVSHI